MYKGYVDSNRGDFKAINVGSINATSCATDNFGLTSTWYRSIFIGANQLMSTGVASSNILLALPTSNIATVGVQMQLLKDAPEMLSFYTQMPTDYKEATDLTAYVHWATTGTTGTTASSGSTQTAVLGLAYSWLNIGSTMPAFATMNGAVTLPYATSGSSGILSIKTTSLGSITGTSKDVGSILQGCIYRDSTAAADTYTVNIAIAGLSLYYQVDTMGSTAVNGDK